LFAIELLFVWPVELELADDLIDEEEAVDELLLAADWLDNIDPFFSYSFRNSF